MKLNITKNIQLVGNLPFGVKSQNLKFELPFEMKSQNLKFELPFGVKSQNLKFELPFGVKSQNLKFEIQLRFLAKGQTSGLEISIKRSLVKPWCFKLRELWKEKKKPPVRKPPISTPLADDQERPKLNTDRTQVKEKTEKFISNDGRTRQFLKEINLEMKHEVNNEASTHLPLERSPENFPGLKRFELNVIDLKDYNTLKNTRFSVSVSRTEDDTSSTESANILTDSKCYQRHKTFCTFLLPFCVIKVTFLIYYFSDKDLVFSPSMYKYSRTLKSNSKNITTFVLKTGNIKFTEEQENVFTCFATSTNKNGVTWTKTLPEAERQILHLSLVDANFRIANHLPLEITPNSKNPPRSETDQSPKMSKFVTRIGNDRSLQEDRGQPARRAHPTWRCKGERLSVRLLQKNTIVSETSQPARNVQDHARSTRGDRLLYFYSKLNEKRGNGIYGGTVYTREELQQGWVEKKGRWLLPSQMWPQLNINSWNL
ncbi:hypothetical protein WN51_05117 [Melipona quadrifasciata]|uniref:Uncharacterized protein n=1 Tax=Melipona quadrifasciata TaxID=166423 RepID=A0A0M8ZTY5_9HYME|nr:hypothetical protein WN51_05117 [Melipona quadrifasciata]